MRVPQVGFRLRTLSVVIACLAVAFAADAWNKRLRRPINRLPLASDVAQMTAISLPGLNGTGLTNEISAVRIASVLGTLAEGRVDPTPAKWVVLGTLTCKMKLGETVEIELFVVNDEEMAFRTDDQHYFRGVDARKFTALVGWRMPQ
jgi:hypothetical protein